MSSSSVFLRERCAAKANRRTDRQTDLDFRQTNKQTDGQTDRDFLQLISRLSLNVAALKGFSKNAPINILLKLLFASLNRMYSSIMY